MTLPVHRCILAMMIRMTEEHGEADHAYISKANREAIDSHKAPGTKYHEWAERMFDRLPPHEQYAARLEAGIMMATDELSSYLADNTEEVFEEIPELDDVRETLIATFS